MRSKIWRVLGLAVALGLVLGGVIAVVRTVWDEGTSAEFVDSFREAGRSASSPRHSTAKTGKNPLPTTNQTPATNYPRPATNPSAINYPLPTNQLPTTNYNQVPKARQVLLANRRIAIATGRSFPKKFCATQTPTSRGTVPYVVISELPVSRDVRIQAVADGARVIGFLPNNALLVEADAQALKNLEEDVLFTAAVEYEPTDKIQRALREKVEKAKSKSEDAVEVAVTLLNEKDVAGIRDYIVENGGEMLYAVPNGGTPKKQSPARGRMSVENRTLRATIPCVLVEKLAGKAEVKWIERHARMKLHNDVAVKPGLMNVTPVREAPLGLTGAGQIITTSDSGIDTGDTDTMHADLTNAVVAMAAYWVECYTNDVSGHGTHTAGSIVGDGTLSGGKIRGAAPGAKLWAWFCDSDYGLLVPEEYDRRTRTWWLIPELLFRPTEWDESVTNAHIHSASWGGDDYGSYSAEHCWMVDAFVWQNPDFLPVFAAGNEGCDATWSQTQIPDTICTPGTAKNVLTVGACESMRLEKGDDCADNPAQIAPFSSCGPCEDGRIKPDIVAPGTYILSCLSTKASRCSWDDGSYAHYQYMGGTSMATPLTAGTAALVREWLARYRAKANPSAALVKAIMMGGATDLYYESGNNVLKSAPDTRQGWGRVDLAGTVAPTNGLATFLADGLPFAAGSNFTFRVTTTNAAPLSVQLAWVDYPGEPSAAKMLVNNLDLCVTGAGNAWLGNGGTEPDDVNNAESVRIREAAATTYIVCVTCTTVPYDHTEGGAAAIYIRGAFDPEDIKDALTVGTIWAIR